MIKCIAIDDEPLALAQLINHVSNVPFLKLLASYNNAFDAMNIMNEEEVDLIFLDINMPGLSGIEFVQSLIVKPFVIFVTAHPEYAIDGFKVDAVDYLLKPYNFYEFLKATDKARKQIKFRLLESFDAQQEQTRVKDSIFINVDSKLIRISISEIKYIEALSEYVRIYVEDRKEPLVAQLSLKKMEERLPTPRFMRIHRSYIVNLHKVTEVFRSRSILINQTHIPIGEAYKELFIKYINTLSIQK